MLELLTQYLMEPFNDLLNRKPHCILIPAVFHGVEHQSSPVETTTRLFLGDGLARLTRVAQTVQKPCRRDACVFSMG
jgi:hypothetical protein